MFSKYIFALASLAIIFTFLLPCSCLFEQIPIENDTVIPHNQKRIITSIASYPQYPALAWTGSEWALAFRTYPDGDIYTGRMDESYNLKGQIRLFCHDTAAPANCTGLVRNGNNTDSGGSLDLLMAYLRHPENEYEIRLARIASDGSTIEDFVLTDNLDANLTDRFTEIALEMHGNTISLLYGVSDCLYFTSFEQPAEHIESLSMQNAPLLLDSGICSSLSLAWDGIRYLAAWTHGSDTLSYASIDATGSTKTEYPTAGFTLDRFCAAYVPADGFYTGGIDKDSKTISLFKLVPETDNPLTLITSFSCSGTPDYFSMAYGPSGFTYCWTELGSTELYLAY